MQNVPIIAMKGWDLGDLSLTNHQLKGEIQNRFNLISEERVTILEQNSENLMKISWKIRKLWDFEVLKIFKKHFLTSRYEYAWVIWWCHRLTIFHSFCTQKWQKKNHISAMRMFNSSLNRCIIIPIYLDIRDKFRQSINIFKILHTKYMTSSEAWRHQLTHLHIHIDWSRNVLWKFAKLQSVITSLFFNRFSSSLHCFVWKCLLFLLKLG